MNKVIKYIILLVIGVIGLYNLFAWLGQSSDMPLYFAIEAFCLCGILALHKEAKKCDM